MNWKPSIAAPILAAALAPAALSWQGPAPQMEVFATPRGNLVAWPAGMLQKTDALEIAAQAENDVASTGRIAGGTVANLGIRTRSAPPRLAGPGSGPARPVIQAFQLRLRDRDDNCSSPARLCADPRGNGCQPGQPGCRCACASPLTAGDASSGSAAGKTGGLLLFVIAPSEAAAEPSVRGALEAMRVADFFLKIGGRDVR